MRLDWAVHQDPLNFVTKQQVELWFRLCCSYLSDARGLLSMAWTQTVERLNVAKSRWQVVKGPLAAMVAILLDLGWTPLKVDLWVKPTGEQYAVDYANALAVAQAWDHLSKSLEDLQWQLVANNSACQGVAQGVDFTVPKKLLKQFRSQGQHRRAFALNLVLQGHLSKVSKLCQRCPLCHEDTHEAHWLRDCNEIKKCLTQPWPLEFDRLCRQDVAHSCFWQCGLVPRLLTHNLGNVRIDLQLESVFAQNWPFENSPEMYFGGDASGGPYSADPRKRNVAFAVVALIKHSGMGVWQVVGSMTANLPGQVQTVPLGEALALLYCLKATLNSFCFVADAQYVYNNRARKLSRNSVATFTHSDVWTEIAEL